MLKRTEFGTEGNLDESASAFLALAEGSPSITEFSVQDARRFNSDAVQRHRGAASPLYATREITIPSPTANLRARLYWPRPGGDLPLLLFFHGGGWVILNIDDYDVLCSDIAAQADVAVLSIDYRLAPEHRFPTAVDDAMTALEFVHLNAQAIGIDPTRIVVGGDSAGGNIAAALVQQTENRAKKMGGICGQALIYPVMEPRANHPSRMLNAKGYLLEEEGMNWFCRHYFSRDAEMDLPAAAPGLTTDLTQQPPSYILSAGFDPLRDEAENFARRLGEAEVDTELAQFHGQTHGFIMRKPLIPEAETAVSHLCGWLKNRL